MKEKLPLIAVVMSGSCLVLYFILIVFLVANNTEIEKVLKKTKANAASIKLNDQLIGKKAYKSSLVTCDSCGLLVWVGKSYTGSGEIRTRRKPDKDGWITLYSNMEEYIYYPKYCKLHKPTTPQGTITIPDSLTFMFSPTG